MANPGDAHSWAKDRKSAGGAFGEKKSKCLLFWWAVWPQRWTRLWLSVKDWRGGLAFRPDSLGAVSLSRDQLSARTDYTGDTDAVSRERVLTAERWSLMGTPMPSRRVDLIQSRFNSGWSVRIAYGCGWTDWSLEPAREYWAWTLNPGGASTSVWQWNNFIATLSRICINELFLKFKISVLIYIIKSVRNVKFITEQMIWCCHSYLKL